MKILRIAGFSLCLAALACFAIPMTASAACPKGQITCVGKCCPKGYSCGGKAKGCVKNNAKATNDGKGKREASDVDKNDITPPETAPE